MIQKLSSYLVHVLRSQDKDSRGVNWCESIRIKMTLFSQFLSRFRDDKWL